MAEPAVSAAAASVSAAMAEMPYLPLLVAAVVAVPEAISLLGAFLQRSYIGKQVPKELEGIYDPAEYETSNKYSKAKSDFKLCKDAFDLAIFFGFWFMKGFPKLDAFCAGFGFESQIGTGLIFISILTVGHSMLDLPWEIYQTFVMEEQFGFNKTTPLTFAKDRVKGLALMAALGVPLLSVVLWFFTRAGTLAWLYVWATVTTFQVVLLFLSPVLIIPMFLQMIPLPEGDSLITGEDKESPPFLSGRLFYGGEEHNKKPSWLTKDRRFTGQGSGSILSICWSSADDTADPCWCIKEGEPEKEGKVYATISEEELTEGCGQGTEGKKWTLTEAGKESAKESKKGEEAAKETAGNAADKKEPLVQPGLRTTCVSVGSLRKKLLDLANKVGYHGANIFVIDGSSRSAHSNAFCTGFGRFRRICLFDTLLPLMSEDETVSVLGHEIGHDRLYHVHKTLVFTIGYLLFMLYMLGQFLHSGYVSAAFFVPEPKVYLGVVLFSIVWSVVDFAVSIPITINSRKNEFEADRFAVEAEPTYGPLLCEALKKLMKKSKANLTPHPLQVFLTYSHPPLDTRLQAIRAYHAKCYGAGEDKKK